MQAIVDFIILVQICELQNNFFNIKKEFINVSTLKNLKIKLQYQLKNYFFQHTHWEIFIHIQI